MSTDNLLPALKVEVSGEVVSSNFKEYKEAAIQVFRQIPTELKTDEDCANAEETIKWLQSVEKKLKDVKDGAIEGTASINDLFTGIDEMAEEARQIRLKLNRTVSAVKQEIRDEIQRRYEGKLKEYLASVNAELGWVQIPMPDVSIADGMKRRRTAETAERGAEEAYISAVDYIKAEKARALYNIEIISNQTKGYEFLFSDKDKLALSSTETLPGIIEQRISSYKLQKELEQVREAERTAREQAEQAKAEPEQEIDEVPEPVLETVNDAPIEANGDVSERPTDEEIISALADYFFADRETVIEWIKEMEL